MYLESNHTHEIYLDFDDAAKSDLLVVRSI